MAAVPAATGAGDTGDSAPPTHEPSHDAPALTPEELEQYGRELVHQILDFALGSPSDGPLIRKWLVAGPDGVAEVSHLRVLRQRGAGRCGYHALLNAATLHDAATHLHTSVVRGAQGLVDEAVSKILNDPLHGYSFITFVERCLGRHCCSKGLEDYFWNFGMLKSDVIERCHMEYLLQQSCLPPTLVEAAQGGQLPREPGELSTPLTPADRVHWDHVMGLGDRTTLLTEFGPSALALNNNPLRLMAFLEPVITQLAAAGAACADAANAWAAAGSRTPPPARPHGSHHAFMVGSGVHWFTVFVEAFAAPCADCAVPVLQEQRAPVGDDADLVRIARTKLGDAKVGLGDRMGEEAAVVSGGVAGLDAATAAGAAEAGAAFVPGYAVYIADSLNADHYFTPPAVKHGVVDTFSYEVDRALPPPFVRAGCLEYMVTGEMVSSLLTLCLTGRLDLRWYLFHAGMHNAMAHVPPALRPPGRQSLLGVDVIAEASKVVGRGLVAAAPFLREQRWRTRGEGEVFKEWEAAQREAGAATRPSVRDIKGSVPAFLAYFDRVAPPTVFHRGVTLNMARILMSLHPGVAGPPTQEAVTALLDHGLSTAATRVHPPAATPVPTREGAIPGTQVSGDAGVSGWFSGATVPFKGRYDPTTTAPPHKLATSMPYLEGATVGDLCAFVSRALEVGGALHPQGATAHPELAQAWAAATAKQRSLGKRALGALQALRTLLQLFGYWR